MTHLLGTQFVIDQLLIEYQELHLCNTPIGDKGKTALTAAIKGKSIKLFFVNNFVAYGDKGVIFHIYTRWLLYNKNTSKHINPTTHALAKGSLSKFLQSVLLLYFGFLFWN